MARWGAFLVAFLGVMGTAWALLVPVLPGGVPASGLAGAAAIPPDAAAIPPDEVVYAYVEFDGRDRRGWPAVAIRPAAGRAVRLSPATGFAATASDGRVYIAPAPVSRGAVDGRLAEYNPDTGRPERALYRLTGGVDELLDVDPSGRWLVLLAYTSEAPDGADGPPYSRRLLTVDLARGRVVAGLDLGYAENYLMWQSIEVKVLWCGGQGGPPCAPGVSAGSPGMAVAVRYGKEEEPPARSRSAKPRYGAEVRVVDVATGAVLRKAFFPTPEAWCRGTILPSSYRDGRVWQRVPCRDARKFPRDEVLRELDLARGAVVREVRLPEIGLPSGRGLPLEHPDATRYYLTRFEVGVTSLTAVDLERGRWLHRRLVSPSPRASAGRGVGLWTRLLGGVARAKGYDNPDVFLRPRLSPDGRLLLVPAVRTVRREAAISWTGGDGIWVLDAHTLRPLRHDLAGRDVWGDFHFSPDGRRAYALEREERRAKTLIVLDLATGRMLKEIPAASLGQLVTLVAAGRSGPGAGAAAGGPGAGAAAGGPCAPDGRLLPRQAGAGPPLDLLQSRGALAVIGCPGLDGGLSVHDWTAPAGERVLFPPGNGVLAAAWSPDGRRLLIQRAVPDAAPPLGAPAAAGALAGPGPPSRGFRTAFSLYDAAGGHLRDVTAWPEEEQQTPAPLSVEGWSPRADHVLLRDWAQSAAPAAGGSPLHVLSLADGRVYALGTTLPKPGFAVWDPQGDRLAFVAGGGREVWRDKRLRLFDAARGRVADLAPDPARADYHPVWSPDGKLIVHVGAGGGDLPGPGAGASGGPRERRIWLLDPATGRRLRLTDDPAYADEYATWTRSGRYLVFVRRPVDPRKTNFEVWRMRPDGSGQEKLGISARIPRTDLDYGEIHWWDLIVGYVDLDRDPPERKRRPW